MKTLAFTFAVALTAAPVAAQSQLELQLGVEPGQYTLSQLHLLKKEQTRTGGMKMFYFGNDNSEGEIVNRRAQNAIDNIGSDQAGDGNFDR